ncbi:putative N-formylglutamate deformylase [Vibrio phage vB_VmeM-32]|nr:putative N-formylglutamate deformylase [Vibrio phage vB_VmeM-32]
MILHIPHSGTDTLHYPIRRNQIELATDWYIDELFCHENSDRIVQTHSRLIVDCERLPDDIEPLHKYGQGIVPTTDFYGNKLKFVIDREYAMRIYNEHHQKLNALVRKTLCYIPTVFVVDCHSFGIHQIPDKRENFDFCFGYNDDFNNFEMLDEMIEYLKNSGYSVGLNKPYSNAIVPSEFYGNESVISIMIEVNKKLYLTDDYKKSDNFENVKYIVKQLLNIISKEEVSYIEI